MSAMEHAEHISHAGHGGGHHDDHGASRLNIYIGVTLAVLGVLLALCTAKVGAERTLLVQALVQEEHAHAKYQAQDVKHRAAVLALTQIHATAMTPQGASVNKDDAVTLAKTVERYLAESHLARDATYTYEPLSRAHMEAQEEYEHGQLAAEIGIILASVALMLKRRIAWFAAMALGGVSIFFIVTTMIHTKHEVAHAQHVIQEAVDKYDSARKANKTTGDEEKMIAEVKAWAASKSP
jgi:hypothetical protein